MHNVAAARICASIVSLFTFAALVMVTGCAASNASQGALTDRVPTSDPLTSADSGAEFRAIWVTTVNNIDWPSKAALHRRVQKDEINAIIARAKALKCNVLMLQVRGMGDRIYRQTTLGLDSAGKYKDEPWSQSLNYDFDPDPNGAYDPFQEWLDACGKAGIEVHAWINPFRVNKLVTVTIGGKDYWLPVILWQKQLYLDPRSAEVQEYVRAVINDFLYHYPPEKDVYAQPIIPNQPINYMLMTGDGPDGVVYDHQIPPDDGGPTTGPSTQPIIHTGAAPSGAAQPPRDAASATTLQPVSPFQPVGDVSAPVGVGTATLTMTPAQKRLDYLKRLYDKTPAKHIPGDTLTGKVESFLDWSYDKVSNSSGRFGLSPDPDVNDPKNYAVPQLAKKKLDYVIPELYGDVPSAQFKTTLKSWINAVPADPDPTLVIAGLNTARVQTPASNSDENTWSPDKILSQMDDVRSTTGANGKKAVGEAHYSGAALREAEEGGPAAEKNLAHQLKDGKYNKHKLPPTPRRTSGNAPAAPTNLKLDTRPDGEYVTWNKGLGRRPRRWEVWTWTPGEGWSDVVLVGEADGPAHRGEIKIDAAVTDVWVKAVDNFNRASSAFGKFQR
jgi:uncharacterized lipoprotein YddW (UPF0748 family)